MKHFYLFSDIRNLTAGTLSQRITSQVMSLKGLNKHLQDIRNYLEKVATGKLPVNHTVNLPTARRFSTFYQT